MRFLLPVKFTFFFLLIAATAFSQKKEVMFVGDPKNDLFALLNLEGYQIKRYSDISAAIYAAPRKSGIFIVSDTYPLVSERHQISRELQSRAAKKKLRIYIEYPASFFGVKIDAKPVETRLERAVVTGGVFGSRLKPMSLVAIHNCHVLPAHVNNPLIVLAKVVGFDKAEYGLDSTKSYPLLFINGNTMVATTKLSNFVAARYGPKESIKQVWSHILSWVTDDNKVQIRDWPTDVAPMYKREDSLPSNARLNSVRKGVEWFYNGRFFVHPAWNDLWLKYQGNGEKPFGPPVDQNLPNGDGSLGILEGHASTINYDGTQQYRYWMRADVQGEASMALAAASRAFKSNEYKEKAVNLIDFVFKNSNLRAGAKNDKNSPAFGLIGWATTHPGVFYGDDNARAILGIIGASAYLNTNKWDKELSEAIMANFRTTGKLGFSGERLEESELLKSGWQHFGKRDLFHPSPHFESWMWACYLWLYNKTGYEPLLAKTKIAIKMTMDAYPNNWLWGSSMQTQRARMILPLAWLVRVENTEEHRRWLDLVTTDMLKYQVESGAIREEIGEGAGRFKVLKSNADYGSDESSLIFKNGDPVAEMLYTCNFALFSLNEAAHATGNERYKAAVNKLSDFLTRIQVKSKEHKDLDGAWFRAFDYDRWDYWASNADVGWGAWCTLTGWIQSWIVAGQLQIQEDESYWKLTQNSQINSQMRETLEVMMRGPAK
ncbi:hypothetical protein ACFSJU_19225 [Paradesertivirga mongoliensis]|uniref:Alpha-L-rhamnosidase six-hairpin glycosidase domain-containing protein n=1 Tax=Paradesertivirga mongoliensis TaxID=2100740 RepID=A0ABW4ZRX9_9SPHI|nr:hypothetical protein [Pedobacter mongoliensis]